MQTTVTTETLDKLYLEWSQFTNARNSREIGALALLRNIEHKGGFDRHTRALIKEFIVKLEP